MNKCPICGAEFEPVAHNAKYCSKSCHRRAANRRYVAKRGAKRKAALGQRTCPTCGVVFKPHDKRQLYCSRACLSRAKRRASQGRPEADAANPRALRIKEPRLVAQAGAQERVRAWLALPPAERYATRDTLTKEDLRLAQKLYLAEPARNAAVNDLMR